MPVPPPEAAVWPHSAWTGARLCCCAASRVRLRAGCRLLACCPRRPAWCGAGPGGHEASRRPAGGFAASARAVPAELEARGVARAVPAGRSYRGGVALPAAGLAPERAGALVLPASAGPGCLSGGGRLLAAPVAAGLVCARRRAGGFRWLARARLAAGYGQAYGPLAPRRLPNDQIQYRKIPLTCAPGRIRTRDPLLRRCRTCVQGRLSSGRTA
jgi:pimeloyl-ACP methyl ester carboxylesterase